MSKDRADADAGATDVPSVPGIRAAASKHKGKLTIGGAVLILGGVAGGLKALGLKLTTIDEKQAAEATQTHDDDAGPPKPRTADRVSALEVRAASVEASVEKMGDRVGALATQQAVMAEKVGALGTQVQQANSDNAARFNRLVDKLDAIRDAPRRGR